jgi:hypothetical protein
MPYDPTEDGQVIEQAPVETVLEPGQPDLTSIQVTVGEGHQMSVADLQKSYEESRGAMHTAMQGNREAQEQYEALKRETEDLVAFRQEVEANPALYQHIQSFYEENGAATPQAIDPQAQTVQSLQHELNQIKQGQQFDGLERTLGIEIPETRRHEVQTHMAKYGIGNIKAAYFDLEGPNLLRKAQKEGIKEGAQMAQRGQGVPQHPQTTTPPQQVDLSKLTGEAFDRAVLDAIEGAQVADSF